ncbi:DUF262 domain-containing protein [Alicyclobacillus fructus]|uniref:GmrSD restriction endonuclease domain-containing protein n=1 Tax=Alicyclobacillus fructus TaxID=2816082 RepID=UPI001A8D9FFE|nr:DUF262 domain-containing protein [Alicyclobacillus fructus]
MLTQKYTVQQQSIDTVLAWIRAGEIAIPEIQRPFVWTPTKVRNFLDSLWNGFPVGYLITWRNPDVRLKDGTVSLGKRLLIDGQQRVTALMAALLGQEVITKDYRRSRIKISFHPLEERFGVYNSAIAKDATWISDVSILFDPNTSMWDLINDYCQRTPSVTPQQLSRILERLRSITSHQIGIIELASDLDIETVTEIFIRVNSEGVPLSQADFAMSKIAVNEEYGGPNLRKAIDYFCHLIAMPEFLHTIEQDAEFVNTPYYRAMTWAGKMSNALYEPSYIDLLRVAFVSGFRRSRLEDLVALLSGRNFETRQYEQDVIRNCMERLQKAVLRFMNESNFKRFVMIIQSAGFVHPSLITSQNALNFSYILFLILKELGVKENEIERYVRRWFVLSMLTGRYSGSSETNIEYDVRQVVTQGIHVYADAIIRGELSDAFWEVALPEEMETSVVSSPYFRVFLAAQVKMRDKGFLSRDITVQDLVQYRGDVHHVFPKDYLQRQGMSRNQYNQIANFVLAQSEINIAIGNKAPKVYFGELREQCNGGIKRYGNIDNWDELLENLRLHCIPEEIFNMTIDDYPEFLKMRRKLMAQKVRRFFEML